MTGHIQKVALIGATGLLGSRILNALTTAGYQVSAIQRKDSTRPVPAGVSSVKVDLSDKDELVSAFKGQDAVISAAPNPRLETEKVMIDACIAASVKRVIPSEYSTNLESPLAIDLPVARDKVEIRRYLTSVIPSTTALTTWTSINNGPFLDVTIKYGIMGPNAMTKKAVFHDGGDNEVGTSTLADIATAVVKVLDATHLAETANQPVYIYSAAVTERYLTSLVSKITGIDFGTVEDGRIVDVDLGQLIRESDQKLRDGDSSVLLNYYYQMMYGNGYGGRDFKKLSWNGRLGLRVMSEEELEGAIRESIM